MSPIIAQTVLTICFVAGKSGGHLLPCITKAQQFQTEYPSSEMYIFSTGNDLDKKIIDKHKNIKHYIPTTLRDVPYQKPWLLPQFTCNVAWYFCKSMYKLWALKPDKVISFGGFNSIPVCLAAKILHIPFEIYELNVEPGKATTLLSYFTDTIFICFEQTKKYFPRHACQLFNYPIRFHNEHKTLEIKPLLNKYKLDVNKQTILVLGGSQGSTLLNGVVKDFIQTYPNMIRNVQFIHQTGAGDYHIYKNFYEEYNIPAVVFDYHETLQDFYNCADLIISRAGAGSLFEIKFFEKRCICIPHETATTNHQIKNIIALQQKYPEQFKIIQQPDFNKETLKQALYEFLK